MKLAVGILALLLVLAGLLAVPLIAHRARAWPDCISHVVIVRGRNGGPRRKNAQAARPFGQRGSAAAMARWRKNSSVTLCRVVRRVTSA